MKIIRIEYSRGETVWKVNILAKNMKDAETFLKKFLKGLNIRIESIEELCDVHAITDSVNYQLP